MPLSKMQGVGMAKILRNSDFNYKNYRNSALGVPLYNKWIFRYGFLKEMWPNPQFSTYLVHLTEEIFTENFKVHFFMYRVSKIINLINFKWSDSVTKLRPSLQFSYFTRLICKKKNLFHKSQLQGVPNCLGGIFCRFSRRYTKFYEYYDLAAYQDVCHKVRKPKIYLAFKFI